MNRITQQKPNSTELTKDERSYIERTVSAARNIDYLGEPGSDAEIRLRRYLSKNLHHVKL